MRCRSQNARFGRLASICLLSALLGASSASAQESSSAETTEATSAVKLNAELGATYSLKPEFTRSEGDGRGKVYSVAVSGAVKEVVRVTLGQDVETVDSPVQETSLADPRLSIAYLPNLLAGTSYTLAPSIRTTLGLSTASRDESYYGNVRIGASLSRKIARWTWAAGGSFTKHIRRYTLTSQGAPNVSSTAAGRLSVGCQLPFDLNLGAFVEYRKSVKYVADSSYSYVNSISLDWSATEHLTLSVGLSDTDAQLDAGGRANSGFDFYRPDRTSLDLGASYAL